MKSRPLLRAAVVLGLTATARGAAAQAPQFAADAQFFRFWDSAGAPIAVVQFTIGTRPPAAIAAPPAAAWLLFRQVDASAGQRDSAWMQSVERLGVRPGERVASGCITVPLIPSIREWSFVGAATRGTPPDLGDVHATEPLPDQPIVVSDLALGAPATADRWRFRDQEVLLTLPAVFAITDSLRLFYQVRSTAAHGDVRTTITVTNVTDSTRGIRVAMMSFPGGLIAGVNASERVLDMTHQRTGKYLVELQVGDLHGGGTSVRSARFVLR